MSIIVCVTPERGIRSMKELIARVRSEPGKWFYASPGNGTSQHLAGAELNRLAGTDMQHVPFKGGAPSLQAVLAGDVQVMIGTTPVVLPQIRAGKLVPLALITRAARRWFRACPGWRRRACRGWTWGAVGHLGAARDPARGEEAQPRLCFLGQQRGAVREVSSRSSRLPNDAARRALQALLHRAGQVVVGGVLVCEQRVAACARHLDRVQHRRRAGILQIRIVGVEIGPGAASPAGFAVAHHVRQDQDVRVFGWWNWSTTCGSGGPKRRANPENSRAVSFCPRNTRTWPAKKASSISRKAPSESGRRDRHRLAPARNPGRFFQLHRFHRGPSPAQSAFAPKT